MRAGHSNGCRAWRIVAVLLTAALAAPAGAAGSYALAASATVLSKSNCHFNTAAGSILAFGAINPSSTSDATASVTLNFTCLGSAATATYSVTSDVGAHSGGTGGPRLQHATDATRFLPYSLNTPLSGSTAKGTPTNVTITGTITVANFANAVSGSYTDIVTITLTP